MVRTLWKTLGCRRAGLAAHCWARVWSPRPCSCRFSPSSAAASTVVGVMLAGSVLLGGSWWGAAISRPAPLEKAASSRVPPALHGAGLHLRLPVLEPRAGAARLARRRGGAGLRAVARVSRRPAASAPELRPSPEGHAAEALGARGRGGVRAVDDVHLGLGDEAMDVAGRLRLRTSGDGGGQVARPRATSTRRASTAGRRTSPRRPASTRRPAAAAPARRSRCWPSCRSRCWPRSLAPASVPSVHGFPPGEAVTVWGLLGLAAGSRGRCCSSWAQRPSTWPGSTPRGERAESSPPEEQRPSVSHQAFRRLRAGAAYFEDGAEGARPPAHK